MMTNKLKTKVFIFCMMFGAAFCFAEDEGVRIIPMLNYDFISLENQQYHAPGGGLILLDGDQEPPLSEKYNNLMVGLFYKPYILKEILPGYSELYHDIDLIVERKIGSHLIQGIFSTYSDKPVYGGFHTTYSSIGYGYELIRKENLHLTLGLALGVGDFGFYLPDGNILPLFPMPIIRLGFNSSIVNLALDFPEVKLTFLPESRVRITGTAHLDIYKFHDIHDFKFNSILWYRFFDKDFAAGDFLGIGLGVQNVGQNDGTDFVLGERDRKYDVNYYSVFGIVDAGLLKLSGGYIFYGREVYDANYMREIGNGFFIKVEALYQFKMKK
jgi:hypothetical protein